MEHKKRKLDSELAGEGGVGQERVRAKIEHYLKLFPPEILPEILKEICLTVPEAFGIVEKRADESTEHKKVFARGLAWTTTAPELGKVLSSHGEVVDISIAVDKASGQNKGYAFVTFATAAGAWGAVQEESYPLSGRTIHVNMAALKPKQGGADSEIVQSSRPVAPPCYPPQSHPGHLSLPMSHTPAQMSQPPAQMAYPIAGPTLPIRAETDSRKIFLRGLSQNCPADVLKVLFSKFGEIENVNIQIDKATGKEKGTAFITYRNSAAVGRALQASEVPMDGRVIHIHPATDRSSSAATQSQPATVTYAAAPPVWSGIPPTGQPMQHSHYPPPQAVGYPYQVYPATPASQATPQQYQPQLQPVAARPVAQQGQYPVHGQASHLMQYNPARPF